MRLKAITKEGLEKAHTYVKSRILHIKEKLKNIAQLQKPDVSIYRISEDDAENSYGDRMLTNMQLVYLHIYPLNFYDN